MDRRFDQCVDPSVTLLASSPAPHCWTQSRGLDSPSLAESFERFRGIRRQETTAPSVPELCTSALRDPPPLVSDALAHGRARRAELTYPLSRTPNVHADFSLLSRTHVPGAGWPVRSCTRR